MAEQAFFTRIPRLAAGLRQGGRDTSGILYEGGGTEAEPPTPSRDKSAIPFPVALLVTIAALIGMVFAIYLLVTSKDKDTQTKAWALLTLIAGYLFG